MTVVLEPIRMEPLASFALQERLARQRQHRVPNVRVGRPPILGILNVPPVTQEPMQLLEVKIAPFVMEGASQYHRLFNVQLAGQGPCRLLALQAALLVGTGRSPTQHKTCVSTVQLGRREMPRRICPALLVASANSHPTPLGHVLPVASGPTALRTRAAAVCAPQGSSPRGPVEVATCVRPDRSPTCTKKPVWSAMTGNMHWQGTPRALFASLENTM